MALDQETLHRDAMMAALQGLMANAAVCARHWSPEMVVNKAAEVADSVVERLKTGRPLEPDVLSQREVKARLIAQWVVDLDGLAGDKHKLETGLQNTIILAQQYLEDCNG